MTPSAYIHDAPDCLHGCSAQLMHAMRHDANIGNPTTWRLAWHLIGFPVCRLSTFAADLISPVNEDIPPPLAKAGYW